MSNADNTLTKLVTVHSGTTVENYKTCAYIQEENVIFNKNKESRHCFKSFFFVPAWQGGLRYAVERARELDHIPCVIAGKVKEEDEYKYELPEGNLFIVDTIWIPRSDVDWRKINAFQKGLLSDVFEELNPRYLLRSH